MVDLGGGSGADAVYFLKQGHSVVVLDISAYALEVAKRRAKDAGLADKLIAKQADFGLHKLPLKDNSVDVAYSRISLNYFPQDQTTVIFNDINRMLKPGGKAYLTLKSPLDKKEMEFIKNTSVEYEPNVFIQNGQLRSRFTDDQLKTMLKNAGVEQYSVQPYKESLGVNDKGYNPELLVNEIVFTKV